jgi:hypothetical protein
MLTYRLKFAECSSENFKLYQSKSTKPTMRRIWKLPWHPRNTSIRYFSLLVSILLATVISKKDALVSLIVSRCGKWQLQQLLSWTNNLTSETGPFFYSNNFFAGTWPYTSISSKNIYLTLIGYFSWLLHENQIISTRRIRKNYKTK